MTTTVITMENTKATTKTKAVCVALASCGVLLAVCGAINIFGTFTEAAKTNERIDARMHAATTLSDKERIAEFNELLDLQKETLRVRPSEPFGWARLAYFRAMTGLGKEEAFAALRMSDFVSPYEVQQLPERAVDWLRYSDVETKEEQAYQDTLWQKAFTVAEKPTWDLALQLGITKLVAASLARRDKKLAEGWRGRMSEAGLSN